VIEALARGAEAAALELRMADAVGWLAGVATAVVAVAGPLGSAARADGRGVASGAVDVVAAVGLVEESTVWLRSHPLE
jgi:hypothetical protein